MTKTNAAPRQKARHRILEERSKNLFGRPFSRRQPFIYLGTIDTKPGQFVLSNTAAEEFKYGDPDFTVAFIETRDPEDLEFIEELFTEFGLSSSDHEVLSILSLMTLCNHAKWEYSALERKRDQFGDLWVKGTKDFVRITNGYNAPYMVEYTRHAVTDILNPTDDAIEIAFSPEGKSNFQLVEIEGDELKSLKAYPSFARGLRLPVIKGIDMIDKAPEDTGDTFSGYRLWSVSDYSLLYTALFTSDHYTFMARRANVILMPTTPRE